MPLDVQLRVDGNDYGGWQDVQVQRSVQQLSGRFSVRHTDVWRDGDQRRPIAAGAEVGVYANDVRLINGYVDDVEPQYDARQHSITINGRDRTADIIDSSAAVREFKNQKFDAIAGALCSPHGVDVVVDADVGDAFKKVTITPGETVYEVLERLARHRGLLLLSDDGRLKITEPSEQLLDTRLELGKNILACRPRFSHRERFAEYIVKSQVAGDDSFNGAAAATPQAKAQDSNIRATRTRIIVAEEPSTIADCAKRAKWQRNVAAGRATQMVYTVQGWFHDGSALWPIDRMVPVKDEWLGIDRALYIVEVNQSVGRNGTLSEITVMPREAFSLMAFPEDSETSTGWKRPGDA